MRCLVCCLLFGVLACSSAPDFSNPETVADYFVQTYYVDTDPKAALAVCASLACKNLEQELTLREGQPIAADTKRPSISAERVRTVSSAERSRRFLYKISIQPEGAEKFEKRATLRVREIKDEWRVTHFYEKKN